eukprot:5807478-Pyramimonas_sp.AAC.1
MSLGESGCVLSCFRRPWELRHGALGLFFGSVYGDPRRQRKEQKTFRRLINAFQVVFLQGSHGAEGGVSTLDRDVPSYASIRL